MIKLFTNHLSQKEKSLKDLYLLIKEFGPVTKGCLVQKTGLKQTTCSRFIDELLQENVIIESGYAESSGGRKPLMYDINPELYFMFGVDISHTEVSVLLINLSLTIKEQAQLKMNENVTPEVAVNFIEQEIRSLAGHHLSESDVLGIGIGAVGPLDRENGLILNPLGFPAGWENVQILDMLHKRLNMKCMLDNRANAALLAEYEKHKQSDYSNVLQILKGVSTQTSIITEGRLVRGTDKLGMFGQGHMIVDIDGRKCICGGYGCLHAYSSIPAIEEDFISRLKRGHASVLRERFTDFDQIKFEDICWAVNEKNDPLACEVIKNAAMYTGIGLSNFINILYPDLIILDGPTYEKMDLFYNTVTKIAAERAKLLNPDHHITFSRGTLGENAVAVGAGKMILEYFLYN
ncbi:ROK family protein [Bacillus freudenreichii]|nr:ROK family protein [Bacillus freudenreichii]